MYDELQEEASIIIGAGREKGIGRGIAVRLASEGVHAVLSDIWCNSEEFPEYPLGTWVGLQDTAAFVQAKRIRALAL